jgi:hypothetical protein
MKFLSIYSYAAGPDNSDGPAEAEMMAMGRLIGEMQTAGVLLDFGGVGGGGMELRVTKAGSKITVTDGPFTESKEVIGGYALMSVATRDEAVHWTKRFLEVAGDGVSELHQLADVP